MKKTFLFAALAALSMVSCMNEEFPTLTPTKGYGYINVNVSNDPVIETRASQQVSSDGWVIKTQLQGSETKVDWAADKAYTAGTYTVFAQNYADEAWKAANENWGAAFYQGSGNVTVVAGQTNSAIIDCETAKNAKLTVNIGELPSTFTDVNVVVKRSDDIHLTFPTEGHTEAFFEADETVYFYLSYKFKGDIRNTESATIKMRGAATHNIINVTANSNGLISVTIKVDESFGEGNSATITFDGATGNEAQNNQQGS